MLRKELFYYVTSGSNVTPDVHWCVTVDYLTIRPVARKGYGSIAHSASPHGLLTREYLFGGKNERKTGEFRYSMTITIRPLVA